MWRKKKRRLESLLATKSRVTSGYEAPGDFWARFRHDVDATSTRRRSPPRNARFKWRFYQEATRGVWRAKVHFCLKTPSLASSDPKLLLGMQSLLSKTSTQRRSHVNSSLPASRFIIDVRRERRANASSHFWLRSRESLLGMQPQVTPGYVFDTTSTRRRSPPRNARLKWRFY